MGFHQLKIGIITRSLITGGAQQHIVKLCQALSDSEIKIHLFLLIRDENNDLRENLPPSVEVHVSPYARHHPRSINWLVRQLTDLRIEVIHSFLWTADAYASFVRTFFLKVPLICSERGDRSLRPYYSRFRNLYDRAFTFRSSSLVCTNSSFGASELVRAGCRAEKMITIPNGIDLKKIDMIQGDSFRSVSGWDENAFVVGIVTRLIDYKGVDTLIKALPLTKNQTIKCMVVGDGPERQNLERLARESGVGDRVSFLGERRPAEAIIKSTNMCVLATRSQSEHCSNSILEYMACGKPVVASRVAGNPELVLDGITGYLVHPDDPGDLAQKLDFLVEQREITVQMGEQGRKRIEEHFRMEIVAERFAAMWREAAAVGQNSRKVKPQ